MEGIMRDNDGIGCTAATSGTPDSQAERLVALAREARLLEFALDGDSDAARALAVRLEAALEGAMEAESPEELSLACSTLEGALEAVVLHGMRLSAQMSDMEIDGVLGTARMPVLTAVLSVRAD
jgi:hypothetical protein